MTEDTPGNGKKQITENINALRYEIGTSSIKGEKPWLPYIGGLLVLTILLGAFLGFQQYSMSQQFGDITARLDELDIRIRAIEKQQAEFLAKFPDSVIVSEVQTLSSKVSALEKRMTPTHSQKKSATDSTKQSKVASKRYYEVKKGDTLYRISKQYGITVVELRRLNKLPPNQPIEVGQKLLISK